VHFYTCDLNSNPTHAEPGLSVGFVFHSRVHPKPKKPTTTQPFRPSPANLAPGSPTTYIRRSVLGLPTCPNPSPHRSRLPTRFGQWSPPPPSSGLPRPRGGRRLASFSASQPSLSSAVQCSADLRGAKDECWKTSIFFYRPMVCISPRAAGRNNSYPTCRGSSLVPCSTGARGSTSPLSVPSVSFSRPTPRSPRSWRSSSPTRPASPSTSRSRCFLAFWFRDF
jgi:hypothetical protein